LDRWCIAAAGVSGVLAIAGGAFGAHALRDRITPEALGWFETGVRYHLVHTLALFGTGLAAGSVAESARRFSAGLFAAGIVLFSGSLYAMALGGPRVLGAVTPLGGMAWIAAWALLTWGSVRGRRGTP
jgi:uncharacterized membrane protein YgdD (TMEM256/DUF423 family)